MGLNEPDRGPVRHLRERPLHRPRGHLRPGRVRLPRPVPGHLLRQPHAGLRGVRATSAGHGLAGPRVDRRRSRRRRRPRRPGRQGARHHHRQGPGLLEPAARARCPTTWSACWPTSSSSSRPRSSPRPGTCRSPRTRWRGSSPCCCPGWCWGSSPPRPTRASPAVRWSRPSVRTTSGPATAKGVGANKVVYGHALRAAIVPIVTIFGLDFAALLGGTIFTELIFQIDGIGLWALNAITRPPLDFPVVDRHRADRGRDRDPGQPGRGHPLRLPRPASEGFLSMSDATPAGGHRPLRAVPHPRRARAGRRRAQLHRRAGPDPRHRGGVRFGQERLVDGRPGPAPAANRPGSGRRSGSNGREIIGADESDDAQAARQRGRDDLPGPADRACTPSTPWATRSSRPTGSPQRRLEDGGPQARHRDARPGRHPAAGPAGRRLPPPVLRRHAPAGDDRDGSGQRPEAADRRRAHHGPRRHRPGADPRPAPGPSARVQLRDR